ncbi:MAG: hypothetical protein VYC44_02030 [Chloroflexota bacterium]|nr:hypothetical protein [Chloroflexota bacterium]
MKQIHGLVVVSFPCPTKDDFIQSFVVFVTGNISSVSAWNFLGATTNPVSSKPFDMSEVRQSIEPFPGPDFFFSTQKDAVYE